MERYQIMDKLEEMQESAFKSNKGSNEAELEFREDVADWIEKLMTINKNTGKEQVLTVDKQWVVHAIESLNKVVEQNKNWFTGSERIKIEANRKIYELMKLL